MTTSYAETHFCHRCRCALPEHISLHQCHLDPRAKDVERLDFLEKGEWSLSPSFREPEFCGGPRWWIFKYANPDPRTSILGDTARECIDAAMIVEASLR